MNMNYKKLLELNNNDTNSILKSILPNDIKLYMVGGYLRDYLLGKESKDYDYVVEGCSAIEFAKNVCEHVDGHFVLLDQEYDIARVVMPDKTTYLDFAGCFGSSIYDDLNRRDLTINSIALKIASEPEVIDINNGIADIEQKVIKSISEKNFIDDPLRIFRIYRFASQLGFEIDRQTEEIACKHYNLINNVAKERIHIELIKFFEGSYAYKNLSRMKNNGMLYDVFPELKSQEKVPPNLHHHLCLIDHSLETVNQLEVIQSTLPNWVQEKFKSDFANGIKYISLLKLACLLHDIGKPSTWNIDVDGRHRFLKHDDVGAEMCFAVLKNLKFSKTQMKYISKLIKYHIYPSQLIRQDEPPSEKSINKMFRKLEDETPDVIVLAMADRLSAQGPEITKEITDYNISSLNNFLQKYQAAKDELAPLSKLLTGLEVINILKLSAGPKVGYIINELKEAQISGDVNTKEEAIEFIKSVKLD